MAERTDIFIERSNGLPIAAIEVKNSQGLTPEKATALRQSLLSYGLARRAPFFLLISQDYGFLWKEPASEVFDAPPTSVFPMTAVIARYFPELPAGERLRGSELELLVQQWLIDLAEKSREAVDEPEKILADSGFLSAIRGATVMAEAVP